MAVKNPLESRRSLCYPSHHPGRRLRHPHGRRAAVRTPPQPFARPVRWGRVGPLSGGSRPGQFVALSVMSAQKLCSALQISFSVLDANTSTSQAQQS